MATKYTIGQRWLPCGALLGTLLFLCSPTSAFAAAEAGEVLTLRGDCSVTSAGTQNALAAGDKVLVADVVQTGDGAKLKLRMIDGTVISVASGSQFTVAAYSTGDKRDAELDLATGLLRAVVSKVSQPSRFEIDTASGVTAVRGTDWFIEAGPDKTRVGVLHGLVRLTSRATHHDVDIPAHWGAKLEAGKDPVPPRLWQKSEFADVIQRTDLN